MIEAKKDLESLKEKYFTKQLKINLSNKSKEKEGKDGIGIDNPPIRKYFPEKVREQAKPPPRFLKRSSDQITENIEEIELKGKTLDLRASSNTYSHKYIEHSNKRNLYTGNIYSSTDFGDDLSCIHKDLPQNKFPKNTPLSERLKKPTIPLNPISRRLMPSYSDAGMLKIYLPKNKKVESLSNCSSMKECKFPLANNLFGNKQSQALGIDNNIYENHKPKRVKSWGSIVEEESNQNECNFHQKKIINLEKQIALLKEGVIEYKKLQNEEQTARVYVYEKKIEELESQLREQIKRNTKLVNEIKKTDGYISKLAEMLNTFREKGNIGERKDLEKKLSRVFSEKNISGFQASQNNPVPFQAPASPIKPVKQHRRISLENIQPKISDRPPVMSKSLVANSLQNNEKSTMQNIPPLELLSHEINLFFKSGATVIKDLPMGSAITKSKSTKSLLSAEEQDKKRSQSLASKSQQFSYGFDFQPEDFELNHKGSSSSESAGADGLEEEANFIFFKENPDIFSSEPVKWTPNDAVDTCQRCHIEFAWYRWRHHCRMCGKLMCHSCCRYKDYVVGYSDQKVRTCIECHQTKEDFQRNTTHTTSIYSSQFNARKIKQEKHKMQELLKTE